MKDHERRPWGEFWTVIEGANYKVKVLIVNPGEALSLQKHFKREETWEILEGSPTIFLGHMFFTGLSDEKAIELGESARWHPGDQLLIAKQQWHRISNEDKVPVVILETQRGKCEESDILRKDDKYGRK